MMDDKCGLKIRASGPESGLVNFCGGLFESEFQVSLYKKGAKF